MIDFIFFRKLITPFIIQLLFWLSVLFFLFVAARDITHHAYLTAAQVIIFGPLLSRVVCEVLLLFFRIYDRVDNIDQKLQP